jgi:hypothetical protein
MTVAIVVIESVFDTASTYYSHFQQKNTEWENKILRKEQINSYLPHKTGE